jgi:hypothetical protein
MLHLSSERLAELADGEPTVAEAEHLAACAICATERSAHQRLLSLAGDERDRIAPPLTEWATLSQQLRAAGIIDEQVSAQHAVAERDGPKAGSNVLPLVAPRSRGRAWLVGLRVAAGLVFAVGFGALGRMSANAPVTPTMSEVKQLALRVVGGGGEIMAPIVPQEGSPFSNVEQALASLELSQRSYDRAVAFIAAHDSTASSPEAGDVFRARLAALDQMAETSRQALAVAPTDLVLNQYYLSTLGAREVTLRQLGSVLAQGQRLVRF